jgi:hypothetical protein
MGSRYGPRARAAASLALRSERERREAREKREERREAIGEMRFFVFVAGRRKH